MMIRSVPEEERFEGSAVTFESGGPEERSGVVRIRKTLSRSPPAPLLERMYDDWRARRPYYTVLFAIAAFVILVLSLLIRAALIE